jgi:AAHS family 4-hydroxybenzoate transporter-like MFS transporter
LAANNDIPGSPVDIGHSLDHGHWSGFQKWVLVLAALALIGDGEANQVLSFALPELMKAWHVKMGALSNVLAAGLVGVLIGNFLGGIVGDRFGRRMALISSLTLFGVTTVGMALSRGIPDITLWRFLAGLGVGGGIPNGAAMIAEFTPVRRRSIAIALGMVFIPIGGFVSGELADWLLPRQGWQGFFVWSGVIPLVIVVLFFFALPESPRWLLRRPHRRAELVKLLGRFGYGFSSEDEFVDSEAKSAKQPLAALFGGDMWMDTALLWAAFLFGLLASYTLFSWGKTVLVRLGYDLHAATSTMAIFNLGGVVGALACGVMFERLGSRWSMILSLGGAAVALVLAFFHFDPKAAAVPMIALMTSEGFFIGVISNGVYTLAANAYPPFVRATGVGNAGAMGRVGAVISSYVAVAAVQGGGPTGYFVLVAITVTLSALPAIFMRRQIARSI